MKWKFAFASLALIGNANALYVDAPVSTTNVTATTAVVGILSTTQPISASGLSSSRDVTATGRTVTAGKFVGDGSGLSGVVASVPANISVTNIYASNTISGSSLISTTAGGLISGTNGYFRNVSATALSGGGAGVTGVTAAAMSYYGLTLIPAGLANVSNTTGSVTATIFSGNVSGSVVNGNAISGSAVFGGAMTANSISVSTNQTSVTSMYASGRVGIGIVPSTTTALAVSGTANTTSVVTRLITLLTGALNGLRFSLGSSIYEDLGNIIFQAMGNLYFNTAGASIALNAFDAASQLVVGCPDFSCTTTGVRVAVNGAVSATSIIVGYAGAGVTPTTAIFKGSSAYTSGGILCSYNGSAWKKYDGTNCVF